MSIPRRARNSVAKPMIVLMTSTAAIAIDSIWSPSANEMPIAEVDDDALELIAEDAERGGRPRRFEPVGTYALEHAPSGGVVQTGTNRR